MYGERNVAILATHEATNFVPDFYDIIIVYLPLYDKDETQEFIDQYPGSEAVDEYIKFNERPYKENSWSTYERIMNHAFGMIFRFLVGTGLHNGTDKRKDVDINLGIKGLLNQWVDVIYCIEMVQRNICL